MFSWLTGWLLNNLTAVLGGAGILSSLVLLALFWFAKPTFDAVVSFFTPILTRLGTIFSEGLDTVWNASGKAIILAVIALWLAFFAGKYQGEELGKQIGKDKILKELHTEYTFIKKKKR